MSCGHGYHGHGCWDPSDWQGSECGYGPGYRRGSGYGWRFTGRYGTVSHEAATVQLEAYLASLKDEIRAIEADLAEIRATGDAEANAGSQG